MSLPTRALDWRRPDGATKAMSARVALNRMAADGLITLPSPRNTNGRHPRHRPDTSHPSRSTSLTNLGTLQLHRFTWSAPEPDSAHYNELIATRHYLGHTLLAGAQLRYLIHARPGSWPP